MNRRTLLRALYALIILVLILIMIGKGAAAMIDERVADTLAGVADRHGIALRHEGVSFVSLRGVSISRLVASLPGAPPFLEIEGARIVISPWDLLAGRPAVTGVAASGVRVVLRRTEDGSWELEGLRRRDEARGTGESRSRLRWPLDLAVSDLAVTVAVPGDSASAHYDDLQGTLDLPRRLLSLALDNDDEHLDARIERVDGGEVRASWNARTFRCGLLAVAVSRLVDLQAARVSGNGLYVRTDEDRTLRAAGTLEDVSINHALLARDGTSGIAFGFDLDVFARHDAVLVRNAAISLGGETVALTGTVARPATRPVVNLRASCDRLDLGKVFAGIPRSLVPRLPDLAASGTMTGHFAFYFDAANPASLDYGWQGRVDSFSIRALAPDIDMKSLDGPFTHVARLPGGETRAIRVGPENPDFTPLASVPRHLVGAVLTAEDGSFFVHGGFSPRHIHEAMIENLRAGRVVRGASTLSMQLAKNLFLTRERTLSRKIEEAILTLALEQDLEKKRMLEIYLNIIEWGPDVWGVGAAARHYFGKPASALGPVESAFLASIIARPNRGWGRDPIPRLGEGWWTYLRIILCKMYKRGDVTLETLRDAGVTDTAIAELTGDSGALAMENAALN